MIKKFICITIIFSILISLHSKIITHNVKIKTKNEPKRIGKILCVGEKGVILWNSRIPYNAELLNDYAEYIPYKEISYIQTRNRLDLYPLLIGIIAGFALAAGIYNNPNYSAEGDSYDPMLVIISIYGGFNLGIVGSIATLFIPRHNKPIQFTKKYSYSKYYVMFISNILPELKTMLEKNEK